MAAARQCKSLKYPDSACGLVKSADQFYGRAAMCKDCEKALKKVQSEASKDTTKSKFFRHCPQCNTVLFYTQASSRDRAERKRQVCKSCAFANKAASYGTCKIDGCSDRAGSTGLCKFHWNIDWRSKNKDAQSEKKREYNAEHKDERREYDRQYRQDHKEEIAQERSEYYRDHKEEKREYDRKYRRDQRKNDPLYKLRKMVSRDIGKGIKRNGSSKGGKSAWKHLPYTKEELKAHLESQFDPWMNWSNHGAYNSETWNDDDQSTWKWQIDHIIPHSTFRYDTMDCDEFRQCWALENLRPLSAKQNLYDSDRSERKKKR